MPLEQPLWILKYPTTHRVALSLAYLPLVGPHRTQQSALFTKEVPPYLHIIQTDTLLLTYMLLSVHFHFLLPLHFHFTPTLRFSSAPKSHWLSNSVTLPTTPLGLAPWAAAITWNIYVRASLKHPCLHQVLASLVLCVRCRRKRRKEWEEDWRLIGKWREV